MFAIRLEIFWPDRLKFMSEKNALANLIELASNVANAYTTALYSADLERGTLTLREQLTLSSALDTESVFTMGNGCLGEVALHQKPRLDDFTGTEASQLEWYTKPEAIKGMMVVPVVRKELEGVLVVDSKESYSFTPKLQKLITGFADQMGWYLSLEKENPSWIDGEPPDFQQMLKWCRFLTDAPHRKALSERLIHIPRSLNSCDATAVVWFESEGTGRVTHSKGWQNSLKALSIQSGVGVCGACLDSGQPMLVPNTMNQPWILFSEGEDLESFGSFMVAPIANDKRMLGMVVCASKSPGGLKQSDIDKLTLMTAFAATAMDQMAATPNASDFILKPSEKTPAASRHFLPVHIKAFESEIIERNSPVSVVSIRIKNSTSLFAENKPEQSDHLLNQVSTYLANKIDLLKLFIRYSDEGLVLLLIGVNEEEANLMEETIQETLAQASLTVDGAQQEVEFDYGSASFPSDGNDLKQLIVTSWTRSTHPEEKIHG